MTANAIWRELGPAGPAPDPGDDHLWALMADYPGGLLITGDRLLLEHPPLEGSTLCPKAWAESLASASRES